jgi:hypothetical protein
MPSFLTLPFWQLGPTAGPALDGVVLGAISPTPAPLHLAGFTALGNQQVVLYNSQSGGSVVLTDETSQPTWSFGDSFGPDQIVVDASQLVSAGITGIGIHVVTGGSYSGTVAPQVQYWDGTQFQTIGGVSVTGNLSSTNQLQVNFPQLPTSGTGSPQLLPLGSAGIKPWLFISFPGLTWTTAATLDSVWLITGNSHQMFSDRTAQVSQTGSNPDFSASPAFIVPQVGDLVLYGDPNNKFFRLNVRIFQSSSSQFTKQWVYWNGSTWTAFPAGTLVDPGNTNQLANTGTQTPPHTDYQLQFLPPVDWQKTTIIDRNNVSHTAYFIAEQVTAVTPGMSPVPPAHITYTVSEIMGSNVTGVPLADGASFNEVVMNASHSCPVASSFIIANSMTGGTITLTVPANVTTYATPFGFTAQPGDSFVVIQTAGSSTPNANLANGFFLLEG